MVLKSDIMGYQAKGNYTLVLNAYESKPQGDGPFPTVILFMHAYGIDDPMKKVCDDLAAEGFYAIGVDSYLNGKFNFQNRSEDAISQSFQVLSHWVMNHGLVDNSRIGAIGFCMGGRHAYLANANSDLFKAVVAYYGFPHRGQEEHTIPQNRIADFTAPVLSIFGSEDKGIPRDAVDAYRQASEGEGSPHRSVVYEGAGHGFLNPYSPNHHAEASEDAWKKTVEHFKKYLM